ncbi:MAG: response regulator [Bryobacteraceae bacterium]
MPHTILIVEDAETCASTLEIVFSVIDNVEVVTSLSAEAAWKLIEGGERCIGAVVTDLQMTGMDGFDLIERIRAHALHRAVPIVVITGLSDPATADRVRRLGADAFFTKPYSPAAVREKLEQLLRHEQP